MMQHAWVARGIDRKGIPSRLKTAWRREVKNMLLLRLLALLAAAIAGCAPGEGAINVTVNATAPVHGIDHLTIVVMNGGATSLPVTVPVMVPGDIPPARSLQLRFMKERHGAVAV